MNSLKIAVAIIAAIWFCIISAVFVVGFRLYFQADEVQADIKKQTAIIAAEAQRDAMRADSQVKVLQAKERLAKVELRNDPEVKASLVRALKVRAVLSAWLPIYLPVFLFAGLSSVAAVYYSFRLVTFKHEGIETPVRAFDAPRLVERSLQVKALEATQGVDVLKLAEAISHRQLQSFGHLARGVRGLMGRDSAKQAALPPVIESPALVPTFEQARRDMKPGHVLLGYRQAQPVFFGIPEFVSCGFSGASGSGKTSKMRFLLSQLAINGVNLHILDAHAGDPESLVNSLGDICKLPNVQTYSPIDTRETIQFFLDDLQGAIHHPEHKEATIYVIDELLPIVETVPDTSRLILKAATEGRKFERFIFAAGQVWPASLFQRGSSVRDALTLRMSARNDELQARLLFKTKEKARIVEGLGLPQMFANSMKFQGVVDVPFCSRDDMNALAATVSQTAMPPIDADDVNDTELVARIKARYPQNNELARLIDRDKGQVSSVLNNPSKMTSSLRNAFLRLLQTA